MANSLSLFASIRKFNDALTAKFGNQEAAQKEAEKVVKVLGVKYHWLTKPYIEKLEGFKLMLAKHKLDIMIFNNPSLPQMFEGWIKDQQKHLRNEYVAAMRDLIGYENDVLDSDLLACVEGSELMGD